MKKYEQAIEYLMKNVLPNLSAGDKIPPEAQLAKEAGVCIMTLRRGVNELCLRGVLSRVPEHRAIVESSRTEILNKQINVLLVRLENDIYYTEILLNLQQQMLSSGRFMPMLHTIPYLESPSEYNRYFINVILDIAIKNNIKVILVIPASLNVITIEKFFARYGISLLALFGESGQCNHQIIHETSFSTYYGLRSMYEGGCRHLYYLGKTDENNSRWEGVKRFFNEFFPMEDPRRHAIHTLGFYEDGFITFKKLMENKTVVDGIQAHNDEAASGIIAAAKEYGLRIPEQLSIVGIDNLSRNMNMKPHLTSFAVPIDELIRETLYALEQLSTHDPQNSILRIILHPMMYPGETIRKRESLN